MDEDVPLFEYVVTCSGETCQNKDIPLLMVMPETTTVMCGVCRQEVLAVVVKPDDYTPYIPEEETIIPEEAPVDDDEPIDDDGPLPEEA